MKVWIPRLLVTLGWLICMAVVVWGSQELMVGLSLGLFVGVCFASARIIETWKN